MGQMTKKLVIIVERLIVNEVIRIIEESGATGFTILPTGGKGSRGVRSEDRAHLVQEFGNVQIDVIANEATARSIADQVVEKHFTKHSGIAYLADVEIFRPERFQQGQGQASD